MPWMWRSGTAVTRHIFSKRTSGVVAALRVPFGASFARHLTFKGGTSLSKVEWFHELVAERYERVATLVTSNLDFSEWGEAFPNRLLGVATLDRLRHLAYRIVFDGDRYRALRPFPDDALQSTRHRKEPNTKTPLI